MDMVNSFLCARPVWLAGAAELLNVGAGFLAEFPSSRERTLLRLTVAGKFRIFVNGSFVAHGPERAAHGYARVEEWDITPYLTDGRNHAAIEVIAPRINTYYTLDEAGFLQAEVVAGGKVLCHTGTGDSGFHAFRLSHRVEQVQRYSFQRGFSEVYRMTPRSDAWRTGKYVPPPEPLEEVPGAKLLPRRAPLPRFPLQEATPTGRQRLTPCKPEKYWSDRFLDNSNPHVRRFPDAEIGDIPLREWQEFSVSAVDSGTGPLRTLDAATYDLGRNLSGFIGLKVTCPAPTRLFVVFDELEIDGRIDPVRNQTLNIVCWNLEAGEYELEAAEPCTLRFLQVAVLAGEARISGVYLRRHEAPIEADAPAGCDAGLRTIFDAAVHTLQQNASDLLMDCPSRERAGWLSDSYFSGRAAHALTGTTDYESAFLENYLLAPQPFPHLPPGMVPMCYPGDHPDGNFIPQWALWLVCELLEFRQRGGDPGILAGFESKIRTLLGWFAGYENGIGLLERLPGWQFVEWSKANELVNDVNIPTNWLYAAALEAASALYGDTGFATRAARVRSTATRLGWDGEFFVDRAIRSDGRLVPAEDRTETCQYYAFYFGAATPASHPALWDLLVRKFGPRRPAGDAYAHIAPANVLYGFWMRLELLSRYGAREQMLDEARHLLLPMAGRTGTFWEHTDTRASCCHGFTSYVACLIKDAF